MFALTHLLSALFLVALFYASGTLLVAYARACEAPRLGAFLSRVALGALAWMCSLFGLACVGLYRGAVVVPLAFGVVGFATLRAARVLRASAGSYRAAAEEFGNRIKRQRLDLWALLPVVLPASLVIAASFFQSLSPYIGWDDNVYHLTLPKRYLEHGGFRPIPFSVYSHWPHAVELLYGLALALQDQVLGKLTHTLFLVLTLLAVYRLCRAHGSRSLACLATLMVLGNDVLLFEAPLAYIDIAFAFFLLVAVTYADDFMHSSRLPLLVVSGLFCGAVAGSKLSGLCAPICVGVALLLAQPLRVTRTLLPRMMLALALPTLLIALPWYLKSYLYTGNPIYPLFYQRFGGIEWSARLGRDFYAWQQAMGMGRTLDDYLLLPWRVVVEGERGYERFDGGFGKFWLAAVPLALLVSGWNRSVRNYVLAACFYFVFWALSSQQARFLIAVLPLLAVAAASAADSLIGKLAARPARAALRALCAIAVGFYAFAPLDAFCRQGFAAAQHYLDAGPEPLRSAVPEGYAWVNRKLPLDAKLMLLNINRGFFLDREYICDSFFEASQMNWTIAHGNHSDDDLDAMLRRLGVTHVYIDNANWGIPYTPLWHAFVRNRRWMKRIYSCHDGSCEIYRLRT